MMDILTPEELAALTGDGETSIEELAQKATSNAQQPAQPVATEPAPTIRKRGNQLDKSELQRRAQAGIAAMKRHRGLEVADTPVSQPAAQPVAQPAAQPAQQPVQAPEPVADPLAAVRNTELLPEQVQAFDFVNSKAIELQDRLTGIGDIIGRIYGTNDPAEPLFDALSNSMADMAKAMMPFLPVDAGFPRVLADEKESYEESETVTQLSEILGLTGPKMPVRRFGRIGFKFRPPTAQDEDWIIWRGTIRENGEPEVPATRVQAAIGVEAIAVLPPGQENNPNPDWVWESVPDAFGVSKNLSATERRYRGAEMMLQKLGSSADLVFPSVFAAGYIKDLTELTALPFAAAIVSETGASINGSEFWRTLETSQLIREQWNFSMSQRSSDSTPNTSKPPKRKKKKKKRRG